MALNSYAVRANEKPQLSHGGPVHRQTPDTDPPIKILCKCRQ